MSESRKIMQPMIFEIAMDLLILVNTKRLSYDFHRNDFRIRKIRSGTSLTDTVFYNLFQHFIYQTVNIDDIFFGEHDGQSFKLDVIIQFKEFCCHNMAKSCSIFKL